MHSAPCSFSFGTALTFVPQVALLEHARKVKGESSEDRQGRTHTGVVLGAASKARPEWCELNGSPSYF